MNLSKILNVLLLIFATLLLTACSRSSAKFSGYIEANLHYLSSSQAGELVALNVDRGDKVKRGQILFQIQRQPYLANMHAAMAAVAEAEAKLNDSLTGERPPELAQIEANIKQAKSKLQYANKEVQRYRNLFKAHSISQEALDQAERDAKVSLQEVNNLQAQLTTAKLPQRLQLIKAAKESVAQAKANLQAARWTLGQTIVKAPIAGEIFDDYYRLGEQVPAQRPVVSLLVPDDKKIIFYVPIKWIHQLKIGQTIQFGIANARASGVIKFISPQAEYTPPVIYSEDSRQKLVYRVEAAFNHAAEAAKWHPGQVVSVVLKSSRSTHGK